MKAALLLVIQSELVQLLVTHGIITPTYDFDDTKLNSVPADAQLVADIEAVFVKHGVTVPAKVDSIIKMLPLLAMLIR